MFRGGRLRGAECPGTRGGCLRGEGDGWREVFLGAGRCWGPVLAVAAGGHGLLHVVDEVAGVAVGWVDDAGIVGGDVCGRVGDLDAVG